MWTAQVQEMARGPRYKPPQEWQSEPFSEVLAENGKPSFVGGQAELWQDPTSERDRRATVVLYMAGDADLLGKRCIAVIGARKVSKEGALRARKLGRQLAERGIVVVSGLASGVDTAALTGAIEAGGRVIAIIGTPLSKVYPAENKQLQEAIYRSHLLISQFPEGSRVFPSNFPARNKTMAALTDASVVIEASDTSGTLHQAVECQRLGRWLGIAQSVAENSELVWPTKFLKYDRCVVLRDTDAFLETVYGH